MSNNHGKVYRVLIEFNKNLLSTEEEIKTFIKEKVEREIYYDKVDNKEKYVNKVKVLSLKDNKLELLCQVPLLESGHEIEISLYYNLKDGKYGSYSYEEITQELSL